MKIIIEEGHCQVYYPIKNVQILLVIIIIIIIIIIMNRNELHLSDDDTPMIHHDTHTHTQRKRLHELRRKLEERKQRKNNKLFLENKNNDSNNWDDDIELPPVPEIEEKEEKMPLNYRDRSRMIHRSRSYTANVHNHNINIRNIGRDIHRPRHRRSNAISNDITVGIMPYITTSDNDDNDIHDEEEKSIQPINNHINNNINNINNNDLDILALRRKVRDRKLRRNHGSFHPIQPTHYRANSNGNPFRHGRITNNPHNHRSHSHRRTRQDITATSTSNSNRRPGNFTYRSTVMSAATSDRHNGNNVSVNRPRLRQPFLVNDTDSLDIIHRRRRNVLINNNERRRRRRNTLNILTVDSTEDAASTSSSLQVNINTNRDEEIARLWQERDSLLQHFHDTIRNTHIHNNNNNNNNKNVLYKDNNISLPPHIALPEKNKSKILAQHQSNVAKFRILNSDINTHHNTATQIIKDTQIQLQPQLQPQPPILVQPPKPQIIRLQAPKLNPLRCTVPTIPAHLRQQQYMKPTMIHQSNDNNYIPVSMQLPPPPNAHIQPPH
eukprot:94986_1